MTDKIRIEYKILTTKTNEDSPCLVCISKPMCRTFLTNDIEYLKKNIPTKIFSLFKLSKPFGISLSYAEYMRQLALIYRCESIKTYILYLHSLSDEPYKYLHIQNKSFSHFCLLDNQVLEIVKYNRKTNRYDR